MHKILVGILILVILGGTGLFIFLSEQETPSPSPILSDDISPTSTSQVDLGAGGNSYSDEKGIYSFLYPNDYVLDTQDPVHIRIYKKNDTQRPQSELSDGALIVFETVSLEGASLGTWVDKRIAESTADGTSKIVEGEKAINQNTYPGFHYTLQGFGTSQNLVLQKDKKSTNAVVITYAVNDPQQKGYQEEIDAVLSSLKLLQ